MADSAASAADRETPALDLRDLQTVTVSHQLLRRVAQQAVRTCGVELDRLSLALVDDDRMREINRRFRDTDHTTDVIAFDAREEGDEIGGEIIISVPTAARQAAAVGHALDVELAWLLAHGVLHVAGMDDATEAELQQMIAIQREIMTQVGLATKS